jgi:hypothetical protein
MHQAALAMVDVTGRADDQMGLRVHSEDSKRQARLCCDRTLTFEMPVATYQRTMAAAPVEEPARPLVQPGRAAGKRRDPSGGRGAARSELINLLSRGMPRAGTSGNTRLKFLQV